jgi:hypothetical protein
LSITGVFSLSEVGVTVSEVNPKAKTKVKNTFITCKHLVVGIFYFPQNDELNAVLIELTCRYINENWQPVVASCRYIEVELLF